MPGNEHSMNSQINSQMNTQMNTGPTSPSVTTDHSKPQGNSEQNTASGTLAVGLLSGLAASACCAPPLLLLTLGVSGSRIGNLTALETFRPLFIAVSLLFLVLAYRRLYVHPRRCAAATSSDAACTDATTDATGPDNPLRWQRRAFWLVTFTVLLAIAFPWFAPLFLD